MLKSHLVKSEQAMLLLKQRLKLVRAESKMILNHLEGESRRGCPEVVDVLFFGLLGLVHHFKRILHLNQSSREVEYIEQALLRTQLVN